VPTPQVVDPEVSRAKFDREIATYRKVEAAHRNWGWLVLDADFPEACVAFAVPKLRPFPIVAATVIDFADYDLRPPSVRFVNPFTREPLVARNLNFSMLRRQSVPPEMFAAMLQQGSVPVTNIVQFNGPTTIPSSACRASVNITTTPPTPVIHGFCIAFRRRLLGLHPGQGLDLRRRATVDVPNPYAGHHARADGKIRRRFGNVAARQRPLGPGAAKLRRRRPQPHRKVGRDGFEGLGLWAGRRPATRSPSRKRSFLPRNTSHRTRHLRYHGARGIVSVERLALPQEALADRPDPQSSTVGCFSLVMPDFATGPFAIDRLASYRPDASGAWRDIPASQAAHMITIVE
jgi:Predicted metal binding domain